jgi:hypothetical protein
MNFAIGGIENNKYSKDNRIIYSTTIIDKVSVKLPNNVSSFSLQTFVLSAGHPQEAAALLATPHSLSATPCHSTVFPSIGGPLIGWGRVADRATASYSRATAGWTLGFMRLGLGFCRGFL